MSLLPLLPNTPPHAFVPFTTQSFSPNTSTSLDANYNSSSPNLLSLSQPQAIRFT